MACCTPLSYLLARMWSAGAAHPAMLGRKVVSCSQPDWQRPRRSEEAKKRESPSSFSHHRNASSSSCQWILGMSSIWMWLLADLFSLSPEKVFLFVLSYPCIISNRLSAFYLFSKMIKCLTFHQPLQEPTLTSRRILYWETVQPLSHNIFLRAFGYIVIPAEQGGEEKAQKEGA